MAAGDKTEKITDIKVAVPSLTVMTYTDVLLEDGDGQLHKVDSKATPATYPDVASMKAALQTMLNGL